jgi:hypothetical protein
MNVWAITYEFRGEERTILMESVAENWRDLQNSLHPAIASKEPTIELVGTLV